MSRIALISAAEFEVDRGLSEYADLYSFGIGAVDSVYGAASLFDKIKDKDIIFVGTCGCFEEFSEPTLHEITRVEWSDYGQRCGKSYGLNLDPISINSPFSLNLEKKTALCSASITTEAHLPESCNVSQVLENIELYGVAKKLIEAKSFSALLCTTNQVGIDSHKQWKKNHKEAAEVTAVYLKNLLHGLN